MVRYTSRINLPRARSVASKSQKRKKPVKKKPEQKMSTTGDELSASQPFAGGVVSSGGALKSGGALLSPAVTVSSGLPGATGGSLGSGGGLQVGGALRSGGKLVSSEDIDKMSHEDMFHTLGEMNLPDYHMLQGVASSFLGMEHPLREPMMRHLGGGFVHPTSIFKAATRDILKAKHPQELARAVHGEFLDQMKGADVGGGLLDSLKSLFRKGVSRVKGLPAKVPGALKGAQLIGSRLSSALRAGQQIASILAPALPPAAREKVEKVAELAGKAQAGVQRGRDVAKQIEAILGPMEAELVKMS